MQLENTLIAKKLLPVGEPAALIGEVENLTAMSKPVGECCCNGSVTGDFSPAVKALVEGEYNRGTSYSSEISEKDPKLATPLLTGRQPSASIIRSWHFLIQRNLA